MKNIYYLICCSLFLLATSCDYDEHLSNTNNNAEIVKIVAHMPQADGKTKVSFEDNESAKILYVDWKESGEQISVLRGEENKTFEQTATTDDAKNVFEGNIPAGSGLFYAIYPSNDQVTNIGAIPYNLSEQTGKLDESKTYMYASAETITDGTEFHFKQLTAIIKPDFNLQEGEKIQSVMVSLPENVYTKGTVNLEDQSYTNDSDNKHTVNILADNEEQIYIYVPAFQVTESVDINFEVYTTHGMYTATKTVAKNIESGVLYETEIEMTLCSDYVWTQGTESAIPVGEGTEHAPYQIVTAKHLQWLLNTVNNGTKASEGMYYKLMHNLVITSSVDKSWTPIGNDHDDRKFYGIFDGNGYMITGTLVSMYSNTHSNHSHVDFGFFGYLGSGSNVQNLNLNLNVTGGNAYKDPNINGVKHSNTGIIAGRNSGGSIKNCRVSGVVNGGRGENDMNISHTGGIVGWNMGIIIACVNISEVNGGYGSNSSFTGGIAGRSGNENYEAGETKGCVNRGKITGGSKGNGSGDKVVSTGGITGSFDKGSIHTSSNYGTVSGANNDYSAGIVGRVRPSSTAYAIVYSCNKDYSTLNTIIGNIGGNVIVTNCTEEH